MMGLLAGQLMPLGSLSGLRLGLALSNLPIQGIFVHPMNVHQVLFVQLTLPYACTDCAVSSWIDKSVSSVLTMLKVLNIQGRSLPDIQ